MYYIEHMCARDRKPRAATRSVRLPNSLDEAIQREADARGSSWSALTIELLDEAIRQRRAPGVAFVDGATGRRAVLAGTGLDVWEIIQCWQEADEDLARTVERDPGADGTRLLPALPDRDRPPSGTRRSVDT